MAKLTAKKRNELPSSSFALPAQRKYPIKTKEGNPDVAHAENAKSRATQQVNKGKMSPSTASKIKAAANAQLRKAGKKK